MYKRLQESIGVDNKNDNLKLLKAPKETNEGSFKPLREGAIAQTDLTYWPNDDGYLYLLTIVDTVSRAIDAEPLRTKSSVAIRNAFNKIFARNYIKPTFKILQCDPGSEFQNGMIRSYFNGKNISIRYGRTGRHNAQAIIEYYNGVIGKVVGNKMSLSEIETSKVNKRWRRDIPKLIQTLNEEFKKEEKPLQDFLGDVKKPNYKEGKKLLKVGDMVHVKLEQPANIVTEKRFTGRWRVGDLRWTKTKKKIVNVLLLPNSYPRYVVEGLPHSSFSRSELLL